MDVLEALKVLGLKRGCDKADLKPAYHKLAMKYHPDKHGGSVESTKKMVKLNEAYEVCCNYEKPPRPNNKGGFCWVNVTGNAEFKIRFDSETFTIKL